jgi:hypothetical protein
MVLNPFGLTENLKRSFNRKERQGFHKGPQRKALCGLGGSHFVHFAVKIIDHKGSTLLFGLI